MEIYHGGKSLATERQRKRRQSLVEGRQSFNRNGIKDPQRKVMNKEH